MRQLASPAFYAQLASRFRTKSPTERKAVILTVLAAFLGILFALAAPHLSIGKRTGRLAADIMIIIGVVAYLGDQLVVPPKKTTFISTCGRIVFAGITMCAIAFICVTPGVDPWLRAYRLTLSLIVLAAVVSDMPHALPKRLFKKFALAQIALVIIQTSILFFVTWSVDGPIAYAGAETISKTLTNTLLGPGYPAPEFIGKFFNNAMEPRLITYDHGQIKGTDGMYDIVHWSRGDIAGTLKSYFEAADSQGSIHLLQSISHTSTKDGCRAIQYIHPPVSGYREFGNMAIADQNAMRCAVILHDRRWQAEIYNAVATWIQTEKNILHVAQERGNCRVVYDTTNKIREFYFVLDANTQNRRGEVTYLRRLKREIVGRTNDNLILPEPGHNAMKELCRRPS